MKKNLQKGKASFCVMLLAAVIGVSGISSGRQPVMVFASTEQNSEVSGPGDTETPVTPEITPEVTPVTEITPETPVAPEATPTPEVTPAPEVTPTPEITPTPEATPTPAPIKEGLTKINGKTVYQLSSGKLLVNDSKIIGKYKYVFGKDGTLTKKYKYYKPGWIQKKSKWYYRLDDGTYYKKKGLRKIGNYYYYLDSDYSRAAGFRKSKGLWYYFRTSNGRRIEKTGWRTISKKRYYIKKNFSMATGAVKLSGKLYYFNAKGELEKNKTTFQYNGKYYRTDSNGVMTRLSDIKGQASVATWKFINQHSSPSQSNAQRFRSCFNWIEAYLHYRSKPFRASDFTGNDWPYRYVLSVLNNGVTGNCYGFACTVASIAKELGYNPYVVITTGDHGFVMIDGKYYDNMGALFGAATHRPYNVYKKVRF